MSRQPRWLPRRKWIRVVLPLGLVAVLLGGGGLAAFESDTVSSFGEGLMWALSLMTTVGFLGGLPKTVEGKLIAAALMLFGFALLTFVTATVSSLFVREDEAPADERDRTFEAEVLGALQAIQVRLDAIERDAGSPPAIWGQSEPAAGRQDPLD